MKKKAVIEKRLREIHEKTKTQNFIVAYSGGKDSTTILHLVLDFSQAHNISVSIIHVDTLVENPVIRSYCNSFLKKLDLWKKKEKRNVKIIFAYPKSDMTFWVNLIGKGYPMPSFRFRWCQKHLKIKPAERALKKEKGILLIGLRLNESIERKRSMNQRFNDMELKNSVIQTFAPMYDWTDDDVWEFLSSVKNSPWGTNYSDLVSLYKEARGECPLIPDFSSNRNGCGTRFGCWVCSVVRKDRTLTNLAIQNSKLKELVNFRNWLIEFCSQPRNRTGFTRKGKKTKNGKGMLSLKARQEILENLLELEKRFGSKLIKVWEIETIKKIWEEDENRFSGII